MSVARPPSAPDSRTLPSLTLTLVPPPPGLVSPPPLVLPLSSTRSCRAPAADPTTAVALAMAPVPTAPPLCLAADCGESERDRDRWVGEGEGDGERAEGEEEGGGGGGGSRGRVSAAKSWSSLSGMVIADGPTAACAAGTRVVIADTRLSEEEETSADCMPYGEGGVYNGQDGVQGEGGRKEKGGGGRRYGGILRR